MHLIGIDIGGTKISICIGDELGKVQNMRRIKTPKTSKEGLKSIVEIIEELLEESSIKDFAAIGISSPGPINVKEGKILNPPNLKGWQNTEIVKFFKNRFSKPVFMNNDANAAAVAEWEFGSSRKVKSLVYLTMSTGMGGGIILDHKLLQGQCDTAGEVGHFVLDINGPDCACGQKGCFEVYCGGASIAKKVQDQIKRENTKTIILDEAEGKIEKIDMIAIIEAVKKKDSYALKIWEEFILRCAQGIGTIIMTLNPDAIILGTIAIHTKALFLKPLRKKLPMFAWKTPLEHCKIEPSILGERISELSSLALAIYGLKEKP